MQDTISQTADYATIERAIHYLEKRAQTQPSLEELADHLHMSPFHVQRLFKRWAGISPKRFIQVLTLKHAKQLLTDSKSVLETTYEVGLSSTSRLHDLFVNVDAMTPAEYKQQGGGLYINYGFHTTPFGDCLLAVTKRGICGLQFVADNGRAAVFETFRAHWEKATLVHDETATSPLAADIFNPASEQPTKTWPLLLKGTNFQVKVWEALLQIPPAAVASYGDVAHMIGKPKASRAVGRAIGRNEIGYLIPCHRVIRQSGAVDGYRWGNTRKKALLAWESGRGDL